MIMGQFFAIFSRTRHFREGPKFTGKSPGQPGGGTQSFFILVIGGAMPFFEITNGGEDSFFGIHFGVANTFIYKCFLEIFPKP